MKAVVLVFDRLARSFLGCYGNTWIKTPHFDRLAVHSVLFEQHFASAFQFAAQSSGANLPRNDFDVEALIQKLQAAEISTTIFSEASDWEKRYAEDSTESADLDCSDQEAPFPILMHQACEVLKDWQTTTEPGLLWLESRGIPFPEISHSVLTESYFLDAAESASNSDPSEDQLQLSDWRSLVKQIEQSQTAKTMQTSNELYIRYLLFLDHWVGLLLDQWIQALSSKLESDPWLFIVTAKTADFLDHSVMLSSKESVCFEELVHTPLFVAVSGQELGSRRQYLVQQHDLLATLADWFQIPVSEAQLYNKGQSYLPLIQNQPETALQEFVWIGPGLPGIEAVRTPDYFWVNLTEGQQSLREHLFLKPEDVWDSFDVKQQYPEVVQELSGLSMKRS